MSITYYVYYFFMRFFVGLNFFDQTESANNDNRVLLENKCSVWLTKKRRQCKHDLVSGTKYCRFHLPSNEGTDHERIQCNYCKTLIFKKKGKQNSKANLSGHYKRCPVKKKLDRLKNQSFYQEKIHFYGDFKENDEKKETKAKIDSQQFISKLKDLYSSIDLTKVIDASKDSSFNEIRDLYFKLHKNKTNLKHCKQIESLIYNINKYYSLSSSNKKSAPIILELGGGKAQFGSMLHRYFKEESKLIIIDINSNFRHKEDNQLENVNNVCRIECGLQHCNISKIKQLNDNHNKERDIMVISKHLCGGATDFGLRCILNDKTLTKNNNIGVIAIALCCRGKCSTETYCNINYLKSINGFQDLNKSQFELIRSMSSWEIDSNHNDNHNKNDKNDNNDNKCKQHHEIGVICRRLIDQGRVEYLKQNGFKNVQLIKYIDKDTTKENILLLALRD